MHSINKSYGQEVVALFYRWRSSKIFVCWSLVFYQLLVRSMTVKLLHLIFNPQVKKCLIAFTRSHYTEFHHTCDMLLLIVFLEMWGLMIPKKLFLFYFLYLYFLIGCYYLWDNSCNVWTGIQWLLPKLIYKRVKVIYIVIRWKIT